MTLIKTSVLSFIATIFKVISGLVINKVISIYIGPAGLAMIGQFQNFMDLVRLVAQAAINNGVVKYTASYKDEESLKSLFSTSMKITIIFSAIVGVSVFAFSNYLSLYIFKLIDYSYIFQILGFSIIFFSLNNLLLSILNGLKEIKTFIFINIVQSVYSLIFTSLLIIYFSFKGALIAMVTNQSIIFIVLLWIVRKHKLIKLSSFMKQFSLIEATKLSKFAMLGITSSILYPVYLIYIRNILIENVGLDSAGIWQGMHYISITLSGIVFTTLSTYYLPKLSEIESRNMIYKELYLAYIFIVPILIAGLVVVFLLKDFIILTLFTEKFLNMRELFLFQLMGDLFRVMAFLLTTIVVAKARIKIAIYSEFFFYTISAIIVFFMIENYGLIGVSYAHAISYAIYFLYGIIVFRKVTNEMQ